MYHLLPTVAQCHEFLAAINRGREAFGLPTLTKLNFDDSDPGTTDNCLSARHLSTPLGGGSGGSRFEGLSSETAKTLADALGTYPYHSRHYGHLVDIPRTISRVTDLFDGEMPGLRERMAEAGIIYT